MLYRTVVTELFEDEPIRHFGIKHVDTARKLILINERLKETEHMRE